jgi:4-hydroxy-4-methyl-2-oxoglutarate aldolase
MDDREKILELYKDLRVADVRDGMDWMMLHHYGTVHYDIRPLWRTRIVGIAKTARYVPYEEAVPKMTPEEYTEWSAWYYREVCPEPWPLKPTQGDILCIDTGGVDVGILGSNNTLYGMRDGIVGYITNGSGIRDTDEVIMQKIPVWSKSISQKMDQGRVRFKEFDAPINLGGVVVNTGDVVVADGDGVIVVPRKYAYDVAKYALQELNIDKAARRKLYEETGRTLDETVL